MGLDRALDLLLVEDLLLQEDYLIPIDHLGEVVVLTCLRVTDIVSRACQLVDVFRGIGG